MAIKKQKRKKTTTKSLGKKRQKDRRMDIFIRLWSDKSFINNSLFFWGLTSILLLVIFFGAISLFAASVDVTVNVLPPPPVITMSANPNPVTAIGGSSVITWSVSDADVGGCTASDGNGVDSWTGVVSNTGTMSVGPININTTYTLTCAGPGGGPTVKHLVINIPIPAYSPSPPIIDSFLASSTSISPGDAVTLTWKSTYTVSCSSPDFVTGGATSNTTGISTGPLVASKTFTLTCINGTTPADYDTKTVTVTVTPVVTVDLSSDTVSAGAGEDIKLTWTAENATSCMASGVTGWTGSKGTSGTDVIVTLPSAPGNYTYTLNCDGVTDSVTVNVGLPPEIVSFSSDKSNVKPSETANLNWNVTGADSCSASAIAPFFAADWTGIIDVTGTKEVTLPNANGNYGYKLTCENAYGSISRNININVSTTGTGGEGTNPIANPIPAQNPNSSTFGGTGGAAGIEITITTSITEIEADSEVGVNVSWVSKGADQCTASGVPGWSGDKPVSGSEQISNPGIEGVYTYVLTCVNDQGSKTIGYFKITVTPPQKIEGVVNIIETDIAPAAPNGEGQTPQLTAPTPIGEILDQTGIIQAFSVAKDKSPWQNILTVVVALSLLGLIGRGIYGLYWARKNRGFVFSSTNGSPVANAKIEIRRSSDGQIMQTILTDPKGRFRFHLKDLKDGKYQVNVEKRDYTFPSRMFAKGGEAAGESTKDSYLGNSFKLIKNDGLRLKIPIDPITVK